MLLSRPEPMGFGRLVVPSIISLGAIGVAILSPGVPMMLVISPEVAVYANVMTARSPARRGPWPACRIDDNIVQKLF
jgi:hypothetical protein